MRSRMKALAVLAVVSLAAALVWTAYASSNTTSKTAAGSCPALSACINYPGTGTKPHKITPPSTGSSVGLCDPNGVFTAVNANDVDALLAKGWTIGIYIQPDANGENGGIACKLTDIPGINPADYKLVPGVLADPNGDLFSPGDPGYGEGATRYPYYMHV